MVSDRMNGIESVKELYLQLLEMQKLRYCAEQGGVFYTVSSGAAAEMEAGSRSPLQSCWTKSKQVSCRRLNRV